MIALEEQRSCCPVACTLDIIGDRWTLLVIRDLMRGVARYSDFLRSPERIATNILANRLAMLTDRGLAEHFHEDGRKRPSYRLTKRGWTLAPVLAEIAGWGLANINDTEARLAPGLAIRAEDATGDHTSEHHRRSARSPKGRDS